jgi:hypothetical protein
LRAKRSNPPLSKPRYGLLRCARNDEMEAMGVTKTTCRANQ